MRNFGGVWLAHDDAEVDAIEVAMCPAVVGGSPALGATTIRPVLVAQRPAQGPSGRTHDLLVSFLPARLNFLPKLWRAPQRAPRIRGAMRPIRASTRKVEVATSKLAVAAQDALERLVPIIAGIDEGTVLFCTCIDANGFIRDSECFASPTQPLATLPVDQLFTLARRIGAAGVLFTSRAEGPSGDSESFTSTLIAAGRAAGVEVVDHVVVDGGERRSLRATTDLWSECE